MLNGWIPEWPKGTDCKSAASCFGGSNPPPSIFFILFLFNVAGWSSLEARRAHNPKVVGSNPTPATRAQVAQLVERRTENPYVVGSIPTLGTFFTPFLSSAGCFFLCPDSAGVNFPLDYCNPRW